ncbi:response regulator, partial [Bacteroidota bacterium]
VELHKGEISFTSRKGTGTTFFVCLQKGDDHLEETEKIVSQEEIISGERISSVLTPPIQQQRDDNRQLITDIKEGKILIAEDNSDLRDFLIESLEPEYFVQAAVDGKDALASLQWFEPDIIICDIKMPRMDGITLCKQLKSSENTSHIPIMMLTSKTSEEAQIEGYDAGADAYVAKPFNIDVLMAQLKAVLRHKDDFRRDYKKDIEFALEEDSLTQLDKKLLERTRELIEQNIMDPDYSVLKLAQDYGLSQDNLNKKLKALIGMTAKSYIRSVKLKRAARLLATGRYTVAEVTYDVGFSDLKYFRKAFKNEFDVSPSEFKSLKA